MYVLSETRQGDIHVGFTGIQRDQSTTLDRICVPYFYPMYAEGQEEAKRARYLVVVTEYCAVGLIRTLDRRV